MQKFFRKIRKTIRDVGSGAKDILRNNPEALMAAIGIPYLLNTMGGTTPGGGFQNFIQKMVGNLATKGSGSGADEIFGTKGSGILGIGQNLLKGLSGVTGGSGKGIEGNAGLISLIMSMLAKKQFEKEREGPLNKKDRWSEIDLKYDSLTGGSPYAKDSFRGMHWDPVTETSYDVKTFPDNKYENYIEDEEGKITNRAQGGIAGLQAGGNPFMNRNRIRGSIGGGMPGGRDPTVQSITGYNPLRQSNPRFVTRANGGSTAGDLADRLEENPGIAQFFPRKFGAISGPGGPKEDKIPAMLSDGEFVMTAKAVDNAGGPKSMYNLMNRLDPDSSRGRGIV
jgi:hypothetical protein